MCSSDLRKLATSRRILCASPDYLKRHGTPADPSELGKHLLLNYTMPGRGSWPFRSQGRITEVPIVATVSADQADVLLALVRNGAGISRLPEFHLIDDFKAGRLVPLLTDFSFNEAICAVVRTRRNLSPRLRVFIEFLERKLQAQPWNLDQRR